jgi:oligopeptidase B
VAERDENRFVYAGTPREGGNPDPKLPRQSDGSPYPLLDPPVAIPDPYGWMRDEKRSDPKVLGHLEKENEYTRLKTAHLVALRGQLYDEMVGSLQETDYTAPRPRGPQYAYYTRTYEGKPYQVHCRAPRNAALPHPNDGEEKEEGNARSQWDGTAESPVFEGEQVLLDVNVLAEGKPYCEVATKVSPSHRLMAYAADFTGDEMCGLYVINLDSRGGEVVDHDPDLVVYGSLQWGVDDSSLFYLKMDATQRPYQLWRRSIAVGDGETGSRGTDELLFEEPNELYWMGIYKSLDGKYLFMEVSSKETSEIWYLDLKPQDGGSSELRCVARRREKVLYEVEHRNGQWWIASNVGGLPNFAVFTCPATEDSAGNWKLVTDASGSVLFDGGYGQSVDGATCFRDHVVVTGREGGLPRVWVLGGIESGSDSGTVTVVTSKDRLTFEEDAYDVMLGSHYEFDTDQLAVVYDSMITPSQTLEIDMSDPSRRRVLKAKRVPGYDRSQYGCDRTFVPSRDGRTQIPVSLVYRKDVMETHLASGEPVHVHLYGYGSYGSCTEADWRATRLPLINRGIVFAQAHVRGGGEMGRQWYEEPDGAKYLCKKNTFYDFIDVANWLVDDRKMTTPALLSCEGRSAGGMLIGASINEAPHLFRAAILGVPFVDVICTMIGTRARRQERCHDVRGP